MSYKYKKIGGNKVTKDGHTMLFGDIVSDLNRKSFVENFLIEQNKEISDLKLEIEADNRNVNDLMDQVHELSGQLANSIPKEDMQAMINDIQPYMVNGDLFYESLKSLLSNSSINKGDSDESKARESFHG